MITIKTKTDEEKALLFNEIQDNKYLDMYYSLNGSVFIIINYN
jgi:hypothetical protein